MTPPVLARHYKFGEFQFEIDSLRLTRNGELLPLSPKAATLLQLFLERRGEVLKKDEIFAALWPNETVDESNLTRNVYLLRKTLTQYAPTEQFIETLPKIGYRFLASAYEVPSWPIATIEAIPRASLTESRQSEITRVQPHALTHDSGKIGWRETILNWVFLVMRTDAPQETLPVRSMAGISRRAKFTLWAVSALLILGFSALIARSIFLPGIRVNSIAVLPFSELGVESRESALGIGMADTVISRLGSLGQIEIRPTSAIRRYSERPDISQIDPLQAGRELNVEVVLTGNIQRTNGRTRVTAQLLRIGDGKALWSATLDEQTSGLFALQDQLAVQLATALQLSLSEPQWRQLSKHDTQNLAAYNHYLRGRLFWNRRSPEWIRKAIESFEAAIQDDPNYALAYSGLADSYSLVVSGMPPLERMPKAKQAAQRALELDNYLSEAHASLGFIKYKFDWDWRGAEEEFMRAIELNPNYATAHHWYGECLGLQGKFDAAHAALRQAERLDPLSLAIKEDIGMVWFRMREYQKALAKYQEVRDLEPEYLRIRSKLGELYSVLGRYDDAVMEQTTVMELRRSSSRDVAALRDAYQKGGWKEYIRKEVELMVSEKMTHGEDFLAKCYMILGDREEALRWLEKSFEVRGEGPLRMKTDPEFDPLRSDPRFIGLLRRAGHTPL